MPDIKAELIAALLECPTIIEFERRDALIRQLPDNIRRNFKTTTAAQIDVIELVTWCMNYQDGLLRLIEQQRLFEGDSLSMARVHAVWLRIQSPAPGTTQRAQLISQAVATLEPGVNLGEEIHRDRVEVASNFLRMIRDRSEYRVLAVQGPKAAGIGLFVDRLQKMCEERPKGALTRQTTTWQKEFAWASARPIWFMRCARPRFWPHTSHPYPVQLPYSNG